LNRLEERIGVAETLGNDLLWMVDHALGSTVQASQTNIGPDVLKYSTRKTHNEMIHQRILEKSMTRPSLN
jgi:hypothetical protein